MILGWASHLIPFFGRHRLRTGLKPRRPGIVSYFLLIPMLEPVLPRWVIARMRGPKTYAREMGEEVFAVNTAAAAASTWFILVIS